MTDQIDNESELLQQRVVEFEEEVARAIDAYVNGSGPYLEAEHRERARALGYDPERVGHAWVNGEQRKRALAVPKVEVFKRRKLDDAPKLKVVVGGREVPITFDKREFKEATQPPTIDQKAAALKEMAKLYATDPFTYAEQKKEWADKLDVAQGVIEKAVKIERDRESEGEQSQTTKLVAIGVGDDAQLWHAPDGTAYATVWINGHWENHRMDQTSFGRWLRAKYGRLNVCKIGGEYIPQTVGAQTLRDAISTLEGVASFHREERPQPVFRVGGDRKVIWIDLGGADWKAVKVTSEGWTVEDRADVAFLRTGQTLPLPKPVRDGSVKALRDVLNVQASQFVLAVGWLLQTLNPVGSYPLLNVEGPSEAGKTTVCKAMLRATNPSRAELRRQRTPDDLLIAARNNWSFGYDNMSYMSTDWSNTLCMISTGISSGTRAHYTNDEEHVFTVKRPVVFSGIPSHLAQRSDLASRTIRLEIQPIVKRRTDEDVEETFVRIWPGVLGALLDGLVGALRDRRTIDVEDAARMMDFEQFAEAGCRAMGFAPDEFVNEYALNRQGLMAMSVETNTVGRAIQQLLKYNPSGFAGQISALYQELESYKGNVSVRDWPKDPTRLSTQLRMLIKPLSAIGIICATGVDRRNESSSQKDVVIKHAHVEPSQEA
jgi:hypothetical protein